MRRLAWIMVFVAAAACDPVHGDQIDALGGEAPTVRIGPLHRPGQPCLTCHDGAIGDPPGFTAAGTIYVNAGDRKPAVNATVTLSSADGSPPFETTTNAAGNFYVVPRDFTPVYPMKVAVSYAGTNVQMVSSIGRDGSCAGCHSDPPGTASPGHVYIPDDGGAP